MGAGIILSSMVASSKFQTRGHVHRMRTALSSIIQVIAETNLLHLHLSFRGTSPTGPATVTVAEDGTTNTVKVSWTPPSNPGTIDGTNLSVIMTYKIACSGVVSFSATVAGDATSYTNPTVFAYGGTETCTVQAINSAGLSSSTSGSVALTV